MPTPGADADTGAVAIEDVLADAGADASVDDVTTTTSDDSADATASADDGTTDATTDDSADDASSADEGADSDRQDGRAMPPKLRSLLKELQAKDPKLAKELKGSYFTAKSFQTVFPSPKEAAKAKEVIDSLGGEQGLQALQAERAEWANVDTQLASGDPKLLDTISPESLSKLTPAVINKFSQADPEGYHRLMSQVFTNTFQQRGGLMDVLYAIKQNIELGKNPEAIQAIGSVEKWIDSLSQAAKAAPTQRADDPERKKFEAEKLKFEQQKEASFRNTLNEKTYAFRKDAVNKELNGYLKNRKVEDDAYGILESNILAEVNRLIMQDKTYAEQAGKLYKSGDLEGLTKFVNARSARVIPDAVKKIYNTFYRLGGGTPQDKKTGTGKQNTGTTKKDAAPAGFTLVNRVPKPSEVDHSRTTFEMKMKNQAILRNGKKITWRDEE